MEGCTGHPLQALADAITIAEFQTPHRPKLYCLGLRIPEHYHKLWPFFVEMMQLQDADFVITHPEGYELNPDY
jgi:N-succinyl-L-ornithine transcarbamylase